MLWLRPVTDFVHSSFPFVIGRVLLQDIHTLIRSTITELWCNEAEIKLTVKECH